MASLSWPLEIYLVLQKAIYRLRTNLQKAKPICSFEYIIEKSALLLKILGY